MTQWKESAKIYDSIGASHKTIPDFFWYDWGGCNQNLSQHLPESENYTPKIQVKGFIQYGKPLIAVVQLVLRSQSRRRINILTCSSGSVVMVGHGADDPTGSVETLRCCLMAPFTINLAPLKSPGMMCYYLLHLFVSKKSLRKQWRQGGFDGFSKTLAMVGFMILF